jgi:hypothetical protein
VPGAAGGLLIPIQFEKRLFAGGILKPGGDSGPAGGAFSPMRKNFGFNPMDSLELPLGAGHFGDKERFSRSGGLVVVFEGAEGRFEGGVLDPEQTLRQPAIL